MFKRILLLPLLLVFAAQLPAQTKPVTAPPVLVTRANMLRGWYGPYRANNDLLYYHLTVRVDPAKQWISGDNVIRFRMLKDGNIIQLDLNKALSIDKILWGKTPLQYNRDTGAVFVDFPQTLRAGHVYSIDFYYSGHPHSEGRFGGMVFSKDPYGHPWIYTACEGDGASIWWPNKDQWRDEVTHMNLSVEIPSNLVDVSNGRLESKVNLGDGYTRWNWAVHYPINNYDVALNIGNYVHFGGHFGKLTLDYYVLPQDLAKAEKQFQQVPEMLAAYTHYFGPYPFMKDGYKLIQVPYAGMEHQSAIAYGNGFTNGYYGRDWTGVGISTRFDFIIIHESAHEWFGNSITAADRSDMWIHEAWATYMESLYVEYRWGKPDAIKYLNGLKPKIQNRLPIVGERGVNDDPPEDQYFKGALMLNTLRSVIHNDPEWFALIHGLYQHFKYQNIMTGDVIGYFNQHTGMNLTPIFRQYLFHAQIPVLELLFLPKEHVVAYKWQAEEPGFAMPIEVGNPAHWQTIHPTQKWQTMPTTLTKEQFQVATNLYYVDVDKQ